MGPAWGKAHLGVLSTLPCQAEEKAMLAEWGKFQEDSGQKSGCNFGSGSYLDTDMPGACCGFVYPCSWPWFLSAMVLLRFVFDVQMSHIHVLSVYHMSNVLGI